MVSAQMRNTSQTASASTSANRLLAGWKFHKPVDQRRIEISGSFNDLSVLEGHRPAITVVIGRAVRHFPAAVPSKNKPVALCNDINNFGCYLTVDAFADFSNRVVDKILPACVGAGNFGRPNNGPIHILIENLVEGLRVARLPFGDSILDDFSILFRAHDIARPFFCVSLRYGTPTVLGDTNERLKGSM